MSRMIHNHVSFVRRKSDQSNPNSNASGGGQSPGNGNGGGNANGKGNPTQEASSNPSPTPAPPAPSPVSTSSRDTSGGTSTENGGGNTSSSGSAPSPSPSNNGGNGSGSISPPTISPPADVGGNGSSPPNNNNNSGSGSSPSSNNSGGNNTFSKSTPQPSSGDISPTSSASSDLPGSPVPSPNTDSSPSYHATLSSYTSVGTRVTTISSGGQTYTSSIIFTSTGLTTIPVLGPTEVFGESGATTHHINAGAIAGAVIGSLVGLLLLLLLILLCRRRRRDDASFLIVSPLMAATPDEQEARLTPAPIEINTSHVTETDHSKYGTPSTPLTSLFNMARRRSSQPFFRNFHARRLSTHNQSTAEIPFRHHPAPPPVAITNPFADPDAVNVSGSGGTSSRLSTFTDISSMLLTSDESRAEIDLSNSTPAVRQRTETMLSRAPTARSTEAIIEQMARRLSEAPVSDISNTAHARKSSELIPEMFNTAARPSRNNSTRVAPSIQGRSWVTELDGSSKRTKPKKLQDR